MNWRIYAKEEFEKNVANHDLCWFFETGNTEILDGKFEEAAEKAYEDFGTEDRWEKMPEQFVAVGSNGKKVYANVMIEHTPIFNEKILLENQV
jgi:hypothetical protein